MKYLEKINNSKISLSSLINIPKELIDLDITYTNLDNRILNGLRKKGVFTIEQLINISIKDLNNIRSFGLKTTNKIIQALILLPTNIKNTKFNIKEKGKTKQLKILSTEEMAKLKNIKSLYNQYSTLQKVADKLNISRERVRQLLNKGAKYGLYEYKTSSEERYKKLISTYNKDMLIKSIRKHVTIDKICSALSIKDREFNKLIQFLDIDFQDYVLLAKKEKLIEQYSHIVDYLGHHPSATEMNKKSSWRNIWVKISRYWGSLESFRKAFGIARPKYNLHPNTIIGFKKSKEKRQEIKKKNIEKILLFIKEYGLIDSKRICDKFGLKKVTIGNYLRELIKDKLIYKIGKGNNVKYISST